MIKNKDYKSVIPTSILTAYPRTFTDIPYTKEIFNELSKSIIPENILINNLAPELEARFKLISKLVKECKRDQIFELAAGYSPRGLIFTSNEEILYIEMDLKKVKNNKIKILKKITKIPEKLYILTGNVIKEKDFNKCKKFFNKQKPITVINEGLLRYLDFEEKKIVAQNIYNLLSEYGGEWITSDLTPKKFISNQNKNLPEVNKNISKISSRNNNSWRFEDEEHVKKFMEEIGFSLEFHYFKEVKKELSSPKILNIKSKEVDRLLDAGMVAVLRVKDKFNL